MNYTPDKIQIDDGFCYPSFPIRDKEDLIICLRYTEPGQPIESCNYYRIRRINIPAKSTSWTYALKDEGDYVTSRPVVVDEKLIFTTKNYVVALNKDSGDLLWQVKHKLWTTHISEINGTLFLNNDKEIKLLSVENGKTLRSKKYSVKWLDSPTVKYNNRLFVSTASSKIIEINPETLEIENEFKYPGGWAIAGTPDFFDNLMLSNSYSAYVSCFDLATNEVKWKVKKQAGTEPKQLIDVKNELFFVVEILQEYRLTAISIKSGKKKWAQDYHVHDIKNLDDNFIAGLLKDQKGNYFIAIINKQNGSIEKEIYASGYILFDDRFQWRLWKGAEIVVDNELAIISYSPNEIYLLAL